MEQRRLGSTGLYVSRLALGTMSWGRDTDEDDASSQLKAFIEAGGTLIDTADVYVDGESEKIVGRMLQGVVRREDVVVATKAVSRRGQHRDRDASRHHLLSALDASLARLGTDHVDLWQMHAYDAATPLEETLGAIDTAVASGRVRYAGISN
jgi:aryl-alcohol dehydrogenase-like predicted oxidoreductase